MIRLILIRMNCFDDDILMHFGRILNVLVNQSENIDMILSSLDI